ncbi:O-antigen ligase family protein [Vibrio alginolyticus]
MSISKVFLLFSFVFLFIGFKWNDGDLLCVFFLILSPVMASVVSLFRGNTSLHFSRNEVFILFILVFISILHQLFVLSVNDKNDLLRSFYVAAQWWICIGVFFLMSFIKADEKDFKFISGIIVFFLIFNVIYQIITGVGFVHATNIYSSLIMLVTLFSCSVNIRRNIMCFWIFFLGLVCIYLMGARFSLLGLILGFVIIQISLNGLIKLLKSLFWIVFIISNSFVVGIVYIYNNGIGFVLNQVVFDYTGKQLFSGREKMWGDFIEAILSSPFYGYGFSAQASMFSDVDYSTHNLLLAIGIQQGVVGVLLFVMIIMTINIMSLSKFIDKGHDYILYPAVIIPVVLFQQSFELSLTQNNVSYMVTFWMLLGLTFFSKVNKTK